MGGSALGTAGEGRKIASPKYLTTTEHKSDTKVFSALKKQKVAYRRNKPLLF